MALSNTRNAVNILIEIAFGFKPQELYFYKTMRKKKAAKLKEEEFWTNFFYFNIPDHINEVPSRLERANFRRYNVDDEEIGWMIEYVRSIYQLDLDETEITNAGIALLSTLDAVNELRLKNCLNIDAGCLEDLQQIKDLELLHLGGTSIGVDDLIAAPLKFKSLKILLLDDYELDEAKLQQLYISLPGGCALNINHQLYPF